MRLLGVMVIDFLGGRLLDVLIRCENVMWTSEGYCWTFSTNVERVMWTAWSKGYGWSPRLLVVHTGEGLLD